MGRGKSKHRMMEAPENGDRMNSDIVIYRADDLGYDDLSCYGSIAVKTVGCGNLPLIEG